MVLERILSSHSLYLTLGGTFSVALVFNWIAIRRSQSIVTIFWGLTPFLIVGLHTYLRLQSIECESPIDCEWSALEYIFSLFIYCASAVVYLLLALRIRVIYRKVCGTEPVLRGSLRTEIKQAIFLFASAVLGLVVAVCLSILIHSGVFVSWKSLAIPTGIPARDGAPTVHTPLPAGSVELAQKILFASQTNLYIQTDQALVLSIHFPDHDAPQEEQEITWQIENGPPLSESRSHEVGPDLRLLVLPPPGRVVDRVHSRFCDGFDLQQAEYVILEDGSLWAWREVVRLYQFLRFASIAGPLGGLFIVMWYFLNLERQDRQAQFELPEGKPE